MELALNLVRPSEIGENYKLTRAIEAALKPNEATGLEAFCNQRYEAAGFKRQFINSVLVPAWVIRRNLDNTGQRALQGYQSTVSGSGAELAETTFLTDAFIDALRPRSVVLQLGAQPINGLVGDVTIPRLVSAAGAFWLTTTGTSPVVSGAISENEGAFDNTAIVAAPCVIGGYAKISHLLLKQTESDLAETIIANDLRAFWVQVSTPLRWRAMVPAARPSELPT